MLAQREIVAAHFDFDRVTHRRKANELDGAADEQTHFHQARTVGGRQIDFSDGGGGAHGERRERLSCGGHGSSRLRFGVDVLDEDGFSEFFADPQPRVADLADDAGIVADEFDPLLFAQAHFAEPRLNVGRGGQFLDADDFAGLDPTERTNVRPGALAIQNFEKLLPLAHCATRVG